MTVSAFRVAAWCSATASGEGFFFFFFFSYESYSLLLLIFLSRFFTVWCVRTSIPFIYLFISFLCVHVNIVAAAKMGIGSIAFRRTDLRESESDRWWVWSTIPDWRVTAGHRKKGRKKKTGQVFQVPVSFWLLLTKLNTPANKMRWVGVKPNLAS